MVRPLMVFPVDFVCVAHPAIRRAVYSTVLWMIYIGRILWVWYFFVVVIVIASPRLCVLHPGTMSRLSFYLAYAAYMCDIWTIL